MVRSALALMSTLPPGDFSQPPLPDEIPAPGTDLDSCHAAVLGPKFEVADAASVALPLLLLWVVEAQLLARHVARHKRVAAPTVLEYPPPSHLLLRPGEPALVLPDGRLVGNVP